MKGIILAGGSGTRLSPLTIPITKQLLPVYDKPMIYYPLATLLQAGVTKFLLICTPKDAKSFTDLLGNGSQWGINIQYAFQEEPKGIAQAFIIGEKFIGKSPIWLILGDNIFFGHGLSETLLEAGMSSYATVFGYEVSDPCRYGVVSLDEQGRPKVIIEKPTKSKSNIAVTGLYHYPWDVVRLAKRLKPSSRGELEITDINSRYIGLHRLQVKQLGRGTAWLDTGTPDSLADASEFVRIIEKRQGLKIACIEEIVYSMGLINKQQLQDNISRYGKSPYGDYLRRLV